MSMNDVITYSVELNEQICHPHTSTHTATNTTLDQIPSESATSTPKNQANQTNSSDLLNKHIHECCIKRGLDRRWIEAGCSSLTIPQASEYLHYQAKSPGILIKGANGQYQVKPDKPWADRQGKKAPRYRTAYGDEYDALLPKHPTEPYYWTDLEALKQRCYKINGHPVLIITEGGFKAISPCSHGIPTIALMGVEMGLTPSKNDPQGKRYLVPSLEYLAKAGFGFVLGFDADTYTKKPVKQALIKLGKALLKFEIPLYNLPEWDESEGKGIDDYIQNQGIEEFRKQLLAQAISFDSWLDEYGSDAFDKKPPKPDIIGGEIAEKYRDTWVYCDELKTWLAYSLETEGIWTRVSEEYLAAETDAIIEARGIRGYGTNAYIQNIISKLKRKLFLRLWDEKSSVDWLPFQNGVLELATNKLHSHSPGFRFTWQLPRDYTVIETGWSRIKSWLNEATGGNLEHQRYLIHFAAATLRGRSDLQKFLHLIGGGGSGKSTYTNLLTALIGESNTATLNLPDLEDKHEIARIFSKRLVVLPDQDKAPKKMSNFKSLTGQDRLSGRRLFENGFEFIFKGLTVLTSNFPVFHSNLGSWLNRRAVMIPFEYECPKHKQLDLMKEFEPELGAFTSYLLSIPDAEIDRTFKGIRTKTLSSTAWESQIRSDGLAAWINDWVIRDDTAKVAIGSNSKEWSHDEYKASSSTLYGSYTLYCQQTNRSAKSPQNFSAELIELTNRVLGWNASKTRTTWAGKTVRVIKGIRLRTDSDPELTTEEQLIHSDNLTDNSNDNPDDIAKSPPPKGYDNHDNPYQEKRENKNNFPSPCDNLVTGTSTEEVVKDNNLSSQPQEEVTPVTSPPEQGLEVVTNSVTEVVTEVVIEDNNRNRETSNKSNDDLDWAYYPYQSNDIYTLRNRANKVKERILDCATQSDLITLFADNKASEAEVTWLKENLLTKSEVARVESAWMTKQGNLFTEPVAQEEKANADRPVTTESESRFKVGDRVQIKGTKITGVLVEYFPVGQSWTIRTNKGFSQPQEHRSEDMLELLEDG